MAARARGLSPSHPLSRRGLLLGAGAAALVAGCGAPERGAPPEGVRRVRYAEDHESQFADLRLPSGTPVATVALLHGGYWLAPYGLDLMDPLADRFTALGYATWNIEYRRTGDGGGFPYTLVDVATALDRLAGPGLPTGLARDVVTVGHSAGGHLAVWAASRTATTPGGAPAFTLRSAVSLAGILDLTRAATVAGSAGPVTAFVGGEPAELPERYAQADPSLLVPASCPVTVVQAESDGVVPDDQGRSYVERARRAGAEVALIEVPGDHTSVIDPGHLSFEEVRAVVDRAVDRDAGAASGP